MDTTQQDLKNILSTPKNLHFIGVGGSGMYPLVQIMLSQGHHISGSDVNEGDIINYERAQGVTVKMGHKAENVNGADLVVYSAAINPQNPERLEALALGIPCVERSRLLGYVTSLYANSLCIAGTHGKTTTTGMATQILQMAELDPAAVIGGKLPLINGYGKSGEQDRIVVESCEFNNTFLEINPFIAVLLNVDDDHLDFFGDMDGLKAAFRKFCSQATGKVLYNADDKNSQDVVAGFENLLTFGINGEYDYSAKELHEHKPGFWAFTVYENKEPICEVLLSAPGRHTIYNALAAYAGARLLGATPSQCAAGLQEFKGTGRRFQLMGENKGVTIIDDYAHHPTELAATLSTAKELGYNSVWAVFQPYTYSRTQLLLNEFADVLPIADHVVMTAIMGGREKAEDYTITTADLAAKIPGSVWFETQQEVADYVMKNAQSGDLVLTLGCGDIYKCAHMMLEKK